MRTLQRLAARNLDGRNYVNELYFLHANAVARARALIGQLEQEARDRGVSPMSTADTHAATLQRTGGVSCYGHRFGINPAAVYEDTVAVDEWKDSKGYIRLVDGGTTPSPATEEYETVPATPKRPSSDVNFRDAADEVFTLMAKRDVAAAELARVKKALGEARHRMHQAMEAKQKREAKK